MLNFVRFSAIPFTYMVILPYVLIMWQFVHFCLSWNGGDSTFWKVISNDNDDAFKQLRRYWKYASYCADENHERAQSNQVEHMLPDSAIILVVSKLCAHTIGTFRWIIYNFVGTEGCREGRVSRLFLIGNNMLWVVNVVIINRLERCSWAIVRPGVSGNADVVIVSLNALREFEGRAPFSQRP